MRVVPAGRLGWLAGSLALACVLVAAGKWTAYRRLAVLSPPACDPTVAAACTVALPRGGKLSVSLQPRPVRVFEEFAVRVVLDGLRASTVEIDFDNIDFDVGYRRRRLAGNGQVFAERTTLHMCSAGGSLWRLTLIVHDARSGEPFSVPFRFKLPGVGPTAHEALGGGDTAANDAE